MEYSGQKRSNFLIVGIVWFFFSLYILLKAIPYQLPLKTFTQDKFLHFTLCFFLFSVGVLIIACITRDHRLLIAYAIYSVAVLMMLVIRDVEIERELIEKVRDHVVGFLVMPYWGVTRLLREKAENWIAAWCALSGAVAFFAACLCRRK